MTNPTRIGVLGCGRIGRMHADLIANRVAGATLATVFDVVPESAAEVANRHALRVSALSSGGKFSFGLCADAAVMADLDPLAWGIERELDELLGHA